MSGSHLSNLLGKLRIKQAATTTNPPKDKSTLDLTVKGKQIRDISGSIENSTPSVTNPTTSTKISPNESTEPSTPLTVNAHADLDNSASAISTEVKVNATEIDRCPICLDDCIEPKQLDKCSHIFCTDCIDHYFQNIKPQCPCCFTIYGEIRGNQPENGTMTHTVSSNRLPGFGRTSTGTIQITYTFPNGIQNEKHPNPGMPYHGTIRKAYLPDNEDGQRVLELLQKAFELRQIFTIGQSRTTGCDNVVTWNDIHHKTSLTGGMENFGYPDHTYLNRVQQELAAKGIK